MSRPPTWAFASAAYIPLISGNLSVIGSSLIIYSILGPGRKTKLKDPQHRLLLAMSIYDVIYSLGRGYSFLLVPDGFGVPGAQGNLATCSLQGFIIQLAHGIGAYNALLAVYYWMTICHGMKADTFTKYEPYFHVLIFLIFVGLGITGVAIGLYNPSFGFCFIASWPWGCESGPDAPPCERFPPHVRGIMNEIFSGMWFQSFILIILLANTAIWWRVRTQEQAVKKYKHKKSEQQFASNTSNRAVLRTQTSSLSVNKASSINESDDRSAAFNGSREENISCEDENNNNNKTGKKNESDFEDEEAFVSTNVSRADSCDSVDESNDGHPHNSTRTATTTTSNGSSKRRAFSSSRLTASSRRKRASKARMVFVQSSLYVLSFMSCYLGPQIFFLVDWLVGQRVFWPVIIVVIFTPLQGFWNAFIYARPIYNRIKRNNPNMPRWTIVKLIFFAPETS